MSGNRFARRVATLFVLAALPLGALQLGVLPSAVGQETPPPRPAPTEAASRNPTATPAVEGAADEEAILANVAAFVKAYNAHDAAAVAALFGPNAQLITEAGDTVEGREAIEQRFSEIFADAPQTRLEVSVDSLHLIGEEVAVEVGAVRELPAPGESPEYGRYTVLHLKRDGRWWMAAARDTAGEPATHHEQLLPLAWLVGEWVDDGGSTVVRTSCRWSENGNFLLQAMTVQIAGQDAMRVEQRIGWDPLAQQYRSWVFDSEGGFAEGHWLRVGNSWVIKSTGVRADGLPAAATSEIVPTGTDGYVWRVHDRVVGGELQPPVEVKVVRAPPLPEALTQAQPAVNESKTGTESKPANGTGAGKEPKATEE